MPGVQGSICSPKALQGGKASLARGTGTGCFPLCLVCILWAFLSAPSVPVGPEAPGWALSLQCLCSSGSLFVCQVPMTSLYPSECLCLQETHVSIVPLKTSGPGYLSCRELQAPEPWSRAACGANGAIGAALSPWLFSCPIPISVLVLPTAAARQEPDKLIDIYRRKAKGEFQSSARTAGIHQDCFLVLFKSFSCVLCHCLRIINRTCNYLSWALI